jgi:hypothetical protein
MSINESREASRYRLSYNLSAVYEGSSEAIPIRPPDLSTRGMFINTPQFLPVGAVLKLRLGFSGAEVLLRAEVRHCMPGLGVGVEFVDLSPEALRAIEEEINNHLATCEGRPVLQN